ncbi:MAG: MBL fold metallo-hydrolase [Verrucomicrobiales bacterium]|nr:MBL fold metallo-hydrolase [Verrucomicrobiales bacterium]
MKIEILDLQHRQTPGIVGAYLLRQGEHAVLVETGPASTLPRLERELAMRGLAVADLDAVLVTHVHLDHAGAAGWLAQRGVPIYCHPRAARHLVDPSVLEAGAREIYGADFDAWWGPMVAAPADRVCVLEDGESVSFGSLKVTALDTPGHARHHHAFLAGDCCFTGDVAGVKIVESGYLSVASAPPQFEPPALLRSLRRIEESGARRLMLTHYGEVTDVPGHLQAYASRVQEVYEGVSTWVAAGRSAAEIVCSYREQERGLALKGGVSEADWERYETVNATSMCADGIRMAVEKAARA